MKEEQTNFKVTDRRLFNADGTPRDVEREETPASTSTASASTASDAPASDASAAATAAASSRAEGRPREAGPSDASSAGRAHPSWEEMPEDAYAEGDIPGAHDPASFINFLMSIASNAASALGMMEHPVTGQRGVDLPLAKHWIDILGMLQQKTRGNLAAQEQQILEGLLSDLRMQYVSLTSTASPSPSRGFTGRDITGGK
ncbi:MAG TPA: DUF1844 domain-containing protein [Pyrinomonadaceae bacterium]|nr:DUF1844 domain-containing protein [Pyrinomonadaceae bacterium]